MHTIIILMNTCMRKVGHMYMGGGMGVATEEERRYMYGCGY